MVEANASSARIAPDAPREADHPHDSLVVRFGADKPLKLDAGVELCAVPDRLPDLRHAQRRAHQCGAGLPCADRRPARRQRASGHRQAGLVGDHGRSRQADRYRALFRDLPQRGRRLHGHHRPGLDQSGDRQALGPGFPGHHHPRHGARAGHAARPSRHRARCSRSPAARWAACRCCNGRRAIRSACSRRCRSPAPPGIRRRTSRSTRSAARRSWPIRTGAAAAISPGRHQSAPRARGRAHGRAHHLSVRRRAAPQIRPQVPGPRQSDLLVRRRFRGRILSAPPGHHRSSSASTPIPISTSRARWTISIWRPTTTACWPMPSRARRRASA